MFVVEIKRSLLSRKTIVTLVVLILVAIVLTFIFPQRFSTPVPKLAAWQQAHPFLAPWVERLGLDHIYSSPIFALLLFVFMLSLLLSSYEQFKIATRRTFGQVKSETVSKSRDCFESSATLEELEKVFKKNWYFFVAQGQGCKRFVKHPWGFWGNVLLHIGMVTVLASSLVVVLAQKRGVIKLYEGEIFSKSSSSWGMEEHGFLAKRLALPVAVRLDRVTPEFWETDDLKQLTTEFSLIGPDAHISRSSISINQIHNYQGVRIYQQGFGSAFFLEFFRKGESLSRSVFLVDQPVKRNKASYGEFVVEKIPYAIKVKFFADADKKTLESRTPLLVLRFVDFGRVVGEATLKAGESGVIDDYMIRLTKVTRWAELIFTVMPGMWGIYMSFFIIVLGPALNYFTPPREFILRSVQGRTLVEWKGTRFEKLYRDEYESVAVMYDVGRGSVQGTR